MVRVLNGRLLLYLSDLPTHYYLVSAKCLNNLVFQDDALSCLALAFLDP
jgi:hypothetical protein